MISFNLRGLVPILFAILHSCVSLVPRICVHNVTSEDQICCPIPVGFSERCGGRGRGSCSPVTGRQDTVESVFFNDDRLNWPIRFFKKMCECEGNFHGIACEECWYGWTGRNCEKKTTIIRRDIKSFTNSERRMFIDILLISHDAKSDFMILKESNPLHSDPLKNPVFLEGTFMEYIASIHRYASRSTLFKNEEMCDKYGYMDYNHNAIAFATWHRGLMLYWERKLARIALEHFNWKGFAIPYWDWLDAKECDVCHNHLMGDTGEFDADNQIWMLDRRSPFHNWTEYCSPPNTNSKCVGCHYRDHFPPLNRKYLSNQFPQTRDLIFTLRHSSFYLPDEKENNMKECRSFHVALEGFCGRPDDESKYLFMHNKVHNMVQGSMCCASTASNDPLFILHHSQVDRIIECWFQIFSPSIDQLPNHSTEAGNTRESNIVGHFPLVKHGQMFIKMKELGIEYDNLHFGRQGFQCHKMAKWIRRNKL